MPCARSSLKLPCGQSWVNFQYIAPTISIIRPGTISAILQPIACSTPNITKAASINGINACVAPPPAFPQPAEAALAVPTTLGANIILV